MTLKKAYLIILAAFVWVILGGFAVTMIDPPNPSTLEDILIGGLLISFSIIFLVGTAFWAGAKGHHPFLGVVLGWLGPIGLLVLVFLSDQSGGSRRGIEQR